MRQAHFVIAAFNLLAFSAWAAGPPSDDQIRQLIVGYWTPSVQPDPLDKSSQNQERRMLERYNQDGTGTVWIYADTICGKLAFTGSFAWAINRGVMVTTIPSGARSTDQFVSIDSKSMTLRFIGKGPAGAFLEHRARAAACSQPGSP